MPLLRSMRRWERPVLAIDHTTKAGAANQAYVTAYGSVTWSSSRARVLLLWREVLDYNQQPGDMAHAEVVPGERTNR